MELLPKDTEEAPDVLPHVASSHAWLGHQNMAWEGCGERRAQVPSLPDVTFVIRFDIILPFVSRGPVHIYPLLVLRFRVGLVFNDQIYIFSVRHKYRSVLHRKDVDESFF